MKAFVDGYDRKVGINEVPRLCPAVEWTYRPLAGSEASDAYTMFLMSSDKKLAKREFLADRITGWRFPDSEDASAEFTKPTPELLAKLNATAFQKIEHVVMGQQSPDYEIVVKPEADDGEEKIEPALSDNEQGVIDAKNSPAGSPS